MALGLELLAATAAARALLLKNVEAIGINKPAVMGEILQAGGEWTEWRDWRGETRLRVST